MRYTRKRFEEVLTFTRNGLGCKYCPIYKQCCELSNRQEEELKHNCEDLLFAYVENGRDVEEFLIGYNCYC